MDSSERQLQLEVISSKLDSMDSSKHTEFLEALKSLNTKVCSTEREVRIFCNLTAGSSTPESLVKILSTGNLSLWNNPGVVDLLISKNNSELLKCAVENIKDFKEADIAKVILYALQTKDSSLLLLVIQKPFRYEIMLEYLKKFGTLQIQAILQELKSIVLEAPECKIYAMNVISLILDSHFTLLAMQPIFFPILRELHETIGNLIVDSNSVEAILSLLKSIQYAPRKPTRLNRLNISDSYIVEKYLDI